MTIRKWKDKKIVVLKGGTSREREISLRTGAAIANSLKGIGYDVSEVDLVDGFGLVDALRDIRPDAVLIALHGKYGEDGAVQGLLEMLKIPYTGGGVLASSVGMDKDVCNMLASKLGIRTPGHALFRSGSDDQDEFVSSLSINLPVIVKPAREGSTINVTIVNSHDELKKAIGTASISDDKILVESYVKGMEVTVGVLNGKVLEPLEIAPKGGFYDFTSKYTKGMTEYIVPARISRECAKQIQGWSERIYSAIECRGTARADYIVDSEGKAYFLEINTIPGMTELSLVPKAAAYAGLSFGEVCEELLESASLKITV